MTNKEAATIVERIRYYMEGGECWAPTEFEAMDMAIESLNRQDIPDINVNDMIYRQMAIDALLGRLRPIFITNQESIESDAMKFVREVLESLPPAQSEIIHCENCKHWVCGYITDNDDFMPPKCGKYQQMVGHSSTDYCSYAVRRTDG